MKKKGILTIVNYDLGKETLSNLYNKALELGYEGLIIELINIFKVSEISKLTSKSVDKIGVKLHYNLPVDKRSFKRRIRKLIDELEKREIRYSLSIDDKMLNIINPNEMKSLGIKIVKSNEINWKTIKKFEGHEVFFEILLDKLILDREYAFNIYNKLLYLELKGKILFSQEKPLIPSVFIPYILSSLTHKKCLGYGPIIRWWNTLW